MRTPCRSYDYLYTILYTVKNVLVPLFASHSSSSQHFFFLQMRMRRKKRTVGGKGRKETVRHNLHLGGSSGPCSPRSVAPGTRRRFSFAAARSEPASAVCIAPGRPDRTANERGAPSSRALVTQSCFPCCSQSSGATRSRSRALHEQCRCSSAVSAAVPPCTAGADVLQLPSRPCRPFNTAHKFPILRSHCSAKRVPSCPQSESTRSYFTSTFADGNITVPSHLHQQPVGTIEVLQVSKAVNSRLRHVTSVQAVA